MNFKQLFIGLYLIVTSCGIYSFTGSSIPVGAETFQVEELGHIAPVADLHIECL